MSIFLKFFNYLLFFFIIGYSIKTLYQNFYTKRTSLIALLIILNVISLLFSFAGLSICNDLNIKLIKADYTVKNVIYADLVSMLFLGIIISIVKFNKNKEDREKAILREENPVDYDELFKTLKGKEK